jgi:hypothetical protein
MILHAAIFSLATRPARFHSQFLNPHLEAHRMILSLIAVESEEQSEAGDLERTARGPAQREANPEV